MTTSKEDEAKLWALKEQIESAGVEAARRFHDVLPGQCGHCLESKELVAQFTQLFFVSMLQEVVSLFNSCPSNARKRDDDFVPAGGLN